MKTFFQFIQALFATSRIPAGRGLILGLWIFLGFNQILFGQSIFTNPINGTNPNTANPYTAGQTVSAGITVSGIGRGSGINGTNRNDEYAANGWNTTNRDPDGYFEWTITLNSCRSINLISFEYESFRSNNNINNFSFRSSVDGFASGIGTPTAGGTTIDLSGAAYQNITGPITFRLYAWGTNNSGHIFSIEDFTFNGTITTNPTANAGSALAAICQVGTSAALGGSVGGGATGGTWSSSAGGSFSPSANDLNATWTPPAGYTGTATLTLTTSGGSCGIATTTKTIVVNPPATVGAVSPNQTICSGNSPTDLSIASATGTIQWQRADNSTFTTGLTNVGTNSTTLTSAQIGSLTATRYFRAVVTSGGCTSATSSTITVTVSPASAVGTVSVNQTICSGTSPANMTIASATGNIQWQRAEDAAFLFNVVDIPGATGTTLTSAQVGPLLETRYFRAVVTSGACAPVTSGVITVTVNPSVIGITPNQTICSGTSPANISVFTATGNIQWQRSTNSGFTAGTVTDIAGATGLTLTSAQAGTITAPTYYRARVRNPGNTCTIYSEVVTVLIDPVNTATSASPNQTVCRNASLVPITFTTTGADNIGTPVNLPPGLTAIWVSNTITISGTPTTAGTYNYTIPLTGGCGSVNATGTITVSASSVITDMTRTVCSGTAFSAVPVNGTDGSVLAGTTYSWPAPVVTGGITGGAVGTNLASITGTLINPTNIPRTATYTVTPQVGTCNGVPFEVVVTVNPTPVIPAQSETICSGSAFNISPVNGAPSAATIVPAGTTYTWSFSSNPNVTGQSNQATAQTSISQTLVNTSNVNQTLTYTVTPTSGAAGSCPGTPFTITVTVNPVPVIPAQTATICSGTAFSVTPTNGTPTVATIVPAGTTYTWTVVDNPNVTGEANQAAPQPLISQTLTNTTNTVQNVVYTVTPTSGVTGNCIGSTFTVTVAIEPRPVISAMTEAICSGDTFTVIPANGTNGIIPAGTTFTWSMPVVTGSMTGGVAGSGGNITGTLTNPTNSPQTATYTVTPTSGTCVGSPFTVTVTVNPRPAVTAMTSIICSGDTFTAAPANGTDGIVPIGTTYTWTAPTLSGGITGGIAGSGANIAGTLTNTSNSVQTAIYTVTPTSGTCAGSPFTVTVTVNPRPAITAMTADVCSEDSFTITPANSTNGIVPAGTTYTWTAPTLSGGITGGIAGSGPNITGTLTNTTNSPQTATYTVTPSSGSCTGSAFTVTITVNPRPAVTAMVESICSGDSFTVTPANGTNGVVPAGISYTWSAPVVTGGVTGGVGGSGSSITGTLANPTNTAQTATYTVIPTSGTCAGSAFTVTVTVNPRPAVTAITETICSGDTFTVIPANGTNGIVPVGISYTWTIPVVTGGITGGAGGSGSGITGTLTNPTNSVQTATYTVTPTSGSCAGSSFTVTITVSPRPAVTNMTETVCNGDSFTITPTNGTNGIVPAGTTYTWSIPTVTGGITGGVAGSGTNITGALTNPTNSAQTATYTVTPTSGSCVGPTFTITVTLSPSASVTNMNSTVCSDEPFNLTPANGTNGIVPTGTTYTWSAPVVSGGMTGGVAGSGTSIGGTLSNPTNIVQTATYTVTPTTGSCAGGTFTVTITVSPKPVISNITQAVCNGDAFTVAPTNGTNGIVPTGTSYTWTVQSVTGGITGAVSGSGSNITGTLSNPTTSPQTATYAVTPTSGSCVGSSFTVTVTVNPLTNLTSQPSTTDFEVCFGDGFAPISVTATGTALTYQWFRNTTNSNSGGTPVPGATSATFAVPSTPEGVAYYYVVVTGTCGSVTSNVSGRYTVFPPVTTFTANLSNTPQTICPGGSFTPISAVATGANLTYQWYSNTTPSNTGGTLIAGATSGSFTPPNTVFGPTYYYVIAKSDCGTVPSAVSGAFSITGATSITPNQAVCVNSPLDPVITHSTTGTTGIGTVTGLPPGVTATWAADVITISGTPTTTVGSPFNYSIQLIGACTTQVATGTITVNPVAQITDMTTSICSVDSFTLTPANGTNGVVPGGTTYSWSAPVVTGGITGGAAGSGAASISGTLTNPTNTVQTATYTVTPLTGSCPGPTFTVTVSVNPSPVIPTQTATTCSGSAFTVSPANGAGTIVPTGTTYTWTVVDNPNVTGDVVQGTPQGNISQTLTNTTNVAQTVVYTVTPTSGAAGNCVGAPFTVTVTVEPAPVIPAQSASTCSGSAFTVAPSNGGATIVPAGTTYTWTVADNPNVTGESNQGTAQASISQTLTNSSNTVQTVIYTVIPISGTCSGIPFTMTVSVNPSPVIPAQTATTCSGSAFTVSPANGAGTIVPTGTTYTWTVVDNPNVTGDVVQGTPQGNISQTLTNTTNVAQTVVYTVTPTSGAAGNCVGAPFTVTVTVQPTSVIPAQTASTCSGSAFTVAPSNGGATIVPAGTTYTWTVADNPNVTGESNQGTAQGSISQTLTNSSNTVQTVIYTVTPISGTCSGTPFTLTVSVNPSPVIPAQTATTCSGSAFTVSPTNSGATIVPLNTSYTWTVVDNPNVTGDVAQGTPQGNISQTLTNTTNISQTVVYTVTPTSGITGNCVGAPFTVTVTVNPRPAVSNITPAPVCSGTAFTVLPADGTNGIVPSGTTYTWPVPIVTGSMTGGASGSNANNISGTLTNTTNTPQTATYTVTPTSGGCTGTPFTVVVTINPTPAIPNQTPPAICSGSAFTVSPMNGVPTAATRVPAGTLYTWTVALNGNVTGESNQPTPQTSISQTLTNTTNTVQSVVYTVTPISGGCAGASFTTTVTVNPSPAIPNQTPAAICSGSAFTVAPSNGGSTIVPSNTRYTWTVVDNPNVTGESNQGTSQTSISQTLTNISNVAQTVVYTVTSISGAAGSCVGPTFTISVTVNPRPLITPSPITQTICSGQTFNVTPVNGTNGIVPAGTTYTWTRVDNTSVTGDSNQSTPQTSISQTLTNNTTSVQTVTYTVTPSVAGCPAGPTFQVVVTINPTPTVTNATLTQTICSGNASTLVNLTSGLGGTAFNWTATATPGVSGFLTSGTGPIPAQTISTTATTQGTVTYVITPSLGICSGPTVNYTIRVNPRPVITINADYCVVAGKVRLTASSTVPISGWSWNTNPIQTTQSIDVDLAGNYTVTATPSSGSGCLGTASISIAQELVVNGSFTAGNTGFVSDYLYLPDLPGVNDELVPDTGTRGYGVGVNGQNYHNNFWGQDHTNNTVGSRNMMIVNGKGGALRIWEQTITVEPNTEYYFSAWAMSINNAGPFARLRFELNGVQVGTIADLLPGVNNNTNAGWQRFNGSVNSGVLSGPITVRIINLEPALGGNDFAIDDISFGTISTFIELTSPTATENQTVCQDSQINDIIYSARSSISGPTISGLPPGVTSFWNGLTLTLSGIPTAAGVFNYTITTTGNCLPATATGTITVLATPTAGIISSDQTICNGGDPLAFVSTAAGTGAGTITYLWESNTNLTSPSWTTISGQTGATYDVPAGLTTTTQYRRTTIATSGTVVCQSVPTEPVQVTIQAIPTEGAIAGGQTVCIGGDPAAITSTTAGTGSGAITYIWESAVSPFTSWTTISGANGASYNPPAGLTATTRYRRTTVSTVNGVSCLSTTSSPVEVTVQSTPTAGVIAAPQTLCGVGDPAAFTSTTNGTGDGTITYRWESAVSPFSTWSTITGANSSTYDAPAGLTVSTQYRRVTISTLNSVSCESAPTAPIEVIIQNTPTAGAIAAAQSICSGGDPVAFTSTTAGSGDGPITYRWESAVSPFSSWTTISGATSETYDVPTGLTVTTQYRRITLSTLNGVTCESPATTPMQVTINPNNTFIPVIPNPSLCIGVGISTIIHTTTGATGIANDGVPGANGLPLGISATWSANTITITGTPTEFGVFNYSIPLTGGCGSVNATGTITVENPNYPITSIDVVNPTSLPGSSTFTVFSPNMTPGTYEIRYSTNGVNGGANNVLTTVAVTTSGQFTWTSPTYSNEGTTVLTINSIQKIAPIAEADPCAYFPPNNNTAIYGFGCSSEYLQTGVDDTFYVPADVFSLKISAYGDGSALDSLTMPVIPGGVINIGVVGNTIFATESPVATATPADYIVSAIGPNGRIVFTYDCSPPPPCSGTGNVYQYTDSEGYTVIRVTGDCSGWTWSPPDGLDEFEVLVVGGGGGGGYGEAGGGGGGAVVYRQYLGITTNGNPGLQGASFTMTPGGQGIGATSSSQAGGPGGVSTFTGSAFNSSNSPAFAALNASGGGGGGSSSTTAGIRQGGTGASGGGGAANGTDESSGGSGTNGNNGGTAIGETFGSAGAGGGGAAILTGSGGNGSGTSTEMEAGSGGNGESRTISGQAIFYGAGGGGTSSGAITNVPGYGGSVYNGTFNAGGNGNNNGVGQSPTTYGSGGGAGRDGGGAGFPGVIYIRYPNYRILPIEYLYFNARYNPSVRSGDLTWATAKEWENDRFEIQRAVNDVNNWETIGQVQGAGYSDQSVEYAYQDMKLPLAGGTIFYRLKQIDFDGDSTYSDTKAIQVDPMAGTTYWRVYPNPTTGDPINLEMLDTGAYDDEEITVRVISATGVFDVIEGTSTRELSLQLSEILRTKAAGLYTVEITWGANREYHKVILVR